MGSKPVLDGVLLVTDLDRRPRLLTALRQQLQRLGCHAMPGQRSDEPVELQHELTGCPLDCRRRVVQLVRDASSERAQLDHPLVVPEQVVVFSSPAQQGAEDRSCDRRTGGQQVVQGGLGDR